MGITGPDGFPLVFGLPILMHFFLTIRRPNFVFLSQSLINNIRRFIEIFNIFSHIFLGFLKIRGKIKLFVMKHARGGSALRALPNLKTFFQNILYFDEKNKTMFSKIANREETIEK